MKHLHFEENLVREINSFFLDSASFSKFFSTGTFICQLFKTFIRNSCINNAQSSFKMLMTEWPIKLKQNNMKRVFFRINSGFLLYYLSFDFRTKATQHSYYLQKSNGILLNLIVIYFSKQRSIKNLHVHH